MKIAVLGCGYVGAEFARQAKAAGHEVLGVVRSEASRDNLRAEGLAAEAFDLYAGDWALLPKQFDAVVYAASTGGGGPEAYALAYDVGVKRSLAWARDVGAQAFVFTSSTGVYRQDDGTLVDEESVVGGAPTRSSAASAPCSRPVSPRPACCDSAGSTVPAVIISSISCVAASASSADASTITSTTCIAMTRRLRCSPRSSAARPEPVSTTSVTVVP
ncbi:MAG: NAD-dependent epimerase/dehydratase family protein [Opitutales bacterium]